jgi:hypothetical protein
MSARKIVDAFDLLGCAKPIEHSLLPRLYIVVAGAGNKCVDSGSME